MSSMRVVIAYQTPDHCTANDNLSTTRNDGTLCDAEIYALESIILSRALKDNVDAFAVRELIEYQFEVDTIRDLPSSSFSDVVQFLTGIKP